MQEAVFGPFFLASKLNVAGSIPVTRFQKPLRMAFKAIPRDAPGRAILLMRSQMDPPWLTQNMGPSC